MIPPVRGRTWVPGGPEDPHFSALKALPPLSLSNGCRCQRTSVVFWSSSGSLSVRNQNQVLAYLVVYDHGTVPHACSTLARITTGGTTIWRIRSRPLLRNDQRQLRPVSNAGKHPAESVVLIGARTADSWLRKGDAKSSVMEFDPVCAPGYSQWSNKR